MHESHQKMLKYVSYIMIPLCAATALALVFSVLTSQAPWLTFSLLILFFAVASSAFFSLKKMVAPLEKLQASLSSLEADLETQKAKLSFERREHATLMSTVFDAVLAVDQDGFPLFYNSKLALLLGKGQPIHGLHLSKFFLESRCKEAFEVALKTKEPQTIAAFPMDTETGQAYYSLTVSPLKRESGEIYGAVGIFHDVTELKKAEKIRIQFVANVSHELRTPLTSIKGFTDTLLQDAKNGLPLSSNHLEIISRNSDRLMSLIQDLLDLSSLESSEQVQKSWIMTKDFTEQVLSQMGSVFEGKKQNVTFTCQASRIFADHQRLEQVLVNLLTNANKYTPNGGKISVHWSNDEKDFTVLSVHDNGPGIPRQHHDRLFERFYRVDKSRSRDQGGTGLGLAIVKHIMQSHEGFVSVQSSPQEGTTFFCKFPMV